MYTIEDKYKLIKNDIIEQNSENPIKIAKYIMDKNYVNIHGPEHHLIDSLAFLVAYRNITGKMDLNNEIEELASRTIKMPGAMCGKWGVCGAAASLGAMLSVINKTTPLSDNDYYKHNMEYTSLVINKMSKLGGPRCCKRNAFISITTMIDFIYQKYNVKMPKYAIECEYSSCNPTCLKFKCPFYKRG